jgi:hypothetical protein
VSGNVDELIEELQPLTVLGARLVSQSLELPGAPLPTFEIVAAEMREHFDANPALDSVNLLIGGRSVGVISRTSLKPDEGRMAGTVQGVSAGIGEGIQLPGLSTRYRLLEFTCPNCASEFRIHYDERDIPACAHGRMVLRQ